MQTIKNTLKKAQESEDDPYLALLALNTTPGPDGLSPSFKLFNCVARMTLPTFESKPVTHLTPDHQMKQSYDKHSRDLSILHPGDVVRMRLNNEKSWSQQGKVIETCKEPRFYNVMNERGNVVRRNRRHLLPSHEKFEIHNEDENLEEMTNPLNKPIQIEDPVVSKGSNEGMEEPVVEQPTCNNSNNATTTR